MNSQSDQINEIAAALSKVQGSMKPALKDNNNPFFKSRYADIASIWDSCRDALAANGLAVVQTLELIEDKQVLVTTLCHSSGQWIKSTIALPIQKPGPQEVGSCITYCRRYALAAIVGVVQDDDDGEKAEESFRKNNYQKPPAKALPQPPERSRIEEDEWDRMDKLILSINNDEYIQKIEKHIGVSRLADINPKDYERTMALLEKAKAKKMEGSNGSSAVA